MAYDKLELETKIAYLEKHLNELSDVVYQQQKALDILSTQHTLLKEKLTALDNTPPSNPFNLADEKPPHY